MATITSVQSNTLSQNSSSPFSVTLGSGVTTGNLLIVAFEEGNNVTITGPTGWSEAGSFQGVAGNVGADIWYAIVGSGGVTAGTTSFSFSFTGGTGHSSGATIREWNSSTGWAASPLDKSTGTTGSSTTIATGSTATTTQAQELVVASLAYGSTPLTESGLTSGYTSGNESTATSGPNTGREAYVVTSSAGAQACQMTISSSSQWAATITTFMPSAGGGSSVFSQVPVNAGLQWRLRTRSQPFVPVPSASSVSLSDAGTGTDTFAPGIATAYPFPPAVPGQAWLRQFKHRQQPLCTSTFSVAFTDTGAGSDTLSAGNVSVPLPALAGRTWLRNFKHRQTPLCTSTFSVALADSGTGTDTFAPGIATSYPFPPATPGQVWLRRFKHRQTYPYIPLQVNISPVGLTDSGAAADTFSAAIINPPLPAVPGQTWTRQFKHRQTPLYTSTFSEDFADTGSGSDALGIASSVSLPDSGTGTDTLTPGAVFTNPLFPATPGKTWKRQYKHAQTYPYIPVQPGVSSVPLADSGTGTDTFAAAILTQLPLPPAQAGKTWTRQFKHRQQPLCTSTFSVDLSDAGAGADALAISSTVPFTDTGAAADALAITALLALADTGTVTDTLAITSAVPLADSGAGADAFGTAITIPSPLYLKAGKTWTRQFKHRQQQIYAATFIPPQQGTVTITNTAAFTVTITNTAAYTVTIRDTL